MKLYDRFGAKGFHSSFATTFGIDFDTYENVCLNRLRGAGCSNNFILPDAQMLSYALEGASAPPQYAGRLYSVAGMNASSNGVFHSKVFLRLGRRSGELLVGSANMTSPGLAGNRELVGMVECSAEDSGERRIVAAAWSYLAARLDQSQTAIAQQIGWMEARTFWLLNTEPATGAIGLRDGSRCAFLTNGNGGIGSQYVGLIDERPVKRLIVISPYWDDNLTALRSLIEELTPDETVLLIEPKRRLFPVEALTTLPAVRLRDLSLLDPVRFFHAKAIIAQTADADHILFGSANCTLAALGTRTIAPINQEACLYRQLRSMAAIEALGLTSILTSENELNPEDIEPQKAEDELPLSELEQRNPGRFECVYDMLTWWPPNDVRSDAKIEILNADGVTIPVTLSEVSSEAAGRRRYWFARTEQPPSFARLRYGDGGSSTLAIILVADSLRQSAKESRSRKAEEAAAQLSEETNEGFWLLEALDVLETAEERQADETKTITRARHVKDKPEGDAVQHRTLDYDKFIEGRHLRSEDGGYQASSLGGSDLSLVRGFLNRILGIVKPVAGDAETQADEDLSAAFDMGDETSDPQRAIEGGEEFAKPPQQTSPKEAEEEKKRAQRNRERRKAQREQIVGAIDAFDKRIQQRAENSLLNAIDVLRLRALITVVAGAGRSGTTAKPGKEQSSLQVFAAAGDHNSWPRLLGRILFIFFGGNRPAIRHLQLDASLNALLADVKECWATCFWTMQACLAAARMHPQNRGMVKSLESLAQRLYAVTQLQQSELAGSETMAIISLMSERYRKRLGLDATAIAKAHLLEVERLFNPPLLRA